MPDSEDQDKITYVCKMGRFVFDANVPMNKIKLIVCSIMGHFFNQKPNEPKIRNESDVQMYARNYLQDNIAAIPFEVSINIL